MFTTGNPKLFFEPIHTKIENFLLPQNVLLYFRCPHYNSSFKDDFCLFEYRIRVPTGPNRPKPVRQWQTRLRVYREPDDSRGEEM